MRQQRPRQIRLSSRDSMSRLLQDVAKGMSSSQSVAAAGLGAGLSGGGGAGAAASVGPVPVNSNSAITPSRLTPRVPSFLSKVLT